MIDGRSSERGLRLPSILSWALPPLLAVDIMFLLSLLAVANITADGPAQRTLAHGVGILTEVDTYLDEHYKTLVEQAMQGADATIALPGFPLEITFAASEVSTSDQAAFRTVLLERSAAKLHDDGAAAFWDGREGDIDTASPQGAARVAIDVLRPTPHTVFFSLVIVSAISTALLVAALALSTGIARGMAVAGLSVFSGAGLFLIAAVALRFALRVAADSTDDEMTREFLRLAQETSWAPIRNGIIMSAGAAIALFASAALQRWHGVSY